MYPMLLLHECSGAVDFSERDQSRNNGQINTVPRLTLMPLRKQSAAIAIIARRPRPESGACDCSFWQRITRFINITAALKVVRERTKHRRSQGCSGCTCLHPQLMKKFFQA